MILGRIRLRISLTFLAASITIATPSKTSSCVALYFDSTSTCYRHLHQSSLLRYLFTLDQKYLQQPREVSAVDRTPFVKSQNHPNSFLTLLVLTSPLHYLDFRNCLPFLRIIFCLIDDWMYFSRFQRKNHSN